MTRASSAIRAGLMAAGVLLAGLSACGDPTGAVPTPPALIELPRSLSAEEVAVIGASNSFAFDLLREVGARDASANLFLSPLSASMALGMALNGTDGASWTQMRAMLGFGQLEEQEINRAYHDLIQLLLDLDPAVEIGLGNSVWARQGFPFHAEFMDRARTHFHAEVRELDFLDPAAVDTINAWVEDVTHGRIRELLQEIPDDAIMYLINAIYFNGDWRRTFDEDRTRPASFTLADGSTAQVQMMSGDIGYRILRGPHGPAGVELPYGGDAFSAVAILPPPDQPMAEFLAGLDVERWREWTEAFAAAAGTEDTDSPGMEVLLPRIELEYERRLNDDLAALGMTDAFDMGLADFTRLTPVDLPAGEGPPYVYVSEVKQKTFLKVDERGTEAAAATSVEIVVESAPERLVFDRPFLFAIRERLTGTILFVGVIGDPRG